MAVTAVIEKQSVFGDLKANRVLLTFSGNYPDEGDAVSAAALGLSVAPQLVIFDGAAAAADGETALVPRYNYVSGKVELYEGSAAGTALTEKTAAEAYPAGCFVRVLALGW